VLVIGSAIYVAMDSKP